MTKDRRKLQLISGMALLVAAIWLLALKADAKSKKLDEDMGRAIPARVFTQINKPPLKEFKGKTRPESITLSDDSSEAAASSPMADARRETK